MKIININTKEILEVEQEHLIAILKNNKDYKIYNQETEISIKNNNDNENQNKNKEESDNEEIFDKTSDTINSEKIIEKKTRKTKNKNTNKTKNVGENNE